MLNGFDFMNRHNLYEMKNHWYGTHECLNQTKTNYTLGNSFKLYTYCNKIPNAIHEQRIINTSVFPVYYMQRIIRLCVMVCYLLILWI